MSQRHAAYSRGLVIIRFRFYKRYNPETGKSVTSGDNVAHTHAHTSWKKALHVQTRGLSLIGRVAERTIARSGAARRVHGRREFSVLAERMWPVRVCRSPASRAGTFKSAAAARIRLARTHTRSPVDTGPPSQIYTHAYCVDVYVYKYISYIFFLTPY